MDTRRLDEIYADEKAESARRSDSRVKSGVGTAAALGGAAFGTGIASRVLPFLSSYIPADLAMKGINKVAPQLGKYLKKGMEQGLNLQDGLDFIKSNLGESEATTEPQNDVQESIREKVWNAFQSGKTQHSDPTISGFLKIANKLKNYRGLNNKDQFINLWNEFELLRHEGKSLPEMMRSLVEAHSASLRETKQQPKRQQQGEPESSPQMNNLMQALQAAAQSRQKRQQPPM